MTACRAWRVTHVAVVSPHEKSEGTFRSPTPDLHRLAFALMTLACRDWDGGLPGALSQPVPKHEAESDLSPQDPRPLLRRPACRKGHFLKPSNRTIWMHNFQATLFSRVEITEGKDTNKAPTGSGSRAGHGISHLASVSLKDSLGDPGSPHAHGKSETT